MANKKDSKKRRNLHIKFAVSADEKKLIETVGGEQDDDTSKWIRAVLKAEIVRLGRWNLK